VLADLLDKLQRRYENILKTLPDEPTNEELAEAETRLLPLVDEFEDIQEAMTRNGVDRDLHALVFDSSTGRKVFPSTDVERSAYKLYVLNTQIQQETLSKGPRRIRRDDQVKAETRNLDERLTEFTERQDEETKKQ
jgi:hypothetical protein